MMKGKGFDVKEVRKIMDTFMSLSVAEKLKDTKWERSTLLLQRYDSHNLSLNIILFILKLDRFFKVPFLNDKKSIN